MNKFTKALRQEIVRDFATRHNGQFNPALFVEEVRTKGPSHPAYEWFEWDQDKAAFQYQVEQARNFARDLRVSFKVEEIGRRGSIRVRETVIPMLLSPREHRSSGGGYYLVDPADPDHLHEHCAQAAVALRAWLNRYEAALIHAGGSVQFVTELVGALENCSARQHEVA